MKLEILNDELKKIDKRLFVKSTVENCSKKSMKNYNIDNIKEVKYSLNVWEKENVISVVIKSQFDTNILGSLNLTPNQVGLLMNLGFTRDKIWKIEKLLVSQYRQN